jgi:hypothetical protein
MHITLDLPPEWDETLRQCAARAGLDVDTFIRHAIEEKLAWARALEGSRPPFVDSTIITEDEVNRFFEEVRAEMLKRPGP